MFEENQAHETAGTKTKKSRVKKPQNKTLGWVAVILILAVAIATAVYYIQRYQDTQVKVDKLTKQLSNPTEVAKAEQQKLLNNVNSVTELPKGESPTVYTVSDTSKLKGQAFFVNAQNGDKVLVFVNAKKAYLYRPSTTKVINIAPLTVNNDQKSN